jgi:uncharacterized protein (TIGR00255 family)
MSGLGRGTAEAGGVRIACEIRTVNQRGLDVSISSSERMPWAEPLIRRLVAASVDRGRVDVNLAVAVAPGRRSGSLIDRKLAFGYARELSTLARRLKLGPPGMDAVLAIPGVVRQQEVPLTPGRLTPLIRTAVNAALARVLFMRRREGAALARDLGKRFDRLESLAAEVGAGWPAAAARQQDRLTARLTEALARMGEERRSARDVVQALERGDVTEELTRIASHLSQCRAALAAGSPVGRRLEFLVQELQREVNTTGAKSTDVSITRVVVAMKEEVERVREQVANLE